jgi:hypothetical protein
VEVVQLLYSTLTISSVLYLTATMTHPAKASSIAIPLAAILPPQTTSPNDILPTPLALLGPLPPTTPIHLALNHLYLSSIPEFESGPPSQGLSSSTASKSRERVLIITGPKEEYASSVEVEDEDYIRERGGDYTVLNRLKRVDIR